MRVGEIAEEMCETVLGAGESRRRKRWRVAGSRVLAADVLCLQRAGGGGVVGAGDDRAAVAEDGELVAVDGEAEEEGIARDGADAGEAGGEGVE